MDLRNNMRNGTAEVIWIDEDLNDDPFGFKDIEREVELPVEFVEDPLTLACVSYRAWMKNKHLRWLDITTITTDQILVEDRVLAEKIRKHYSAQYLMQRLSGRKLTAYQNKAATFLAGRHRLLRSELGMVYRMPYFYAEDMVVDEVMRTTQHIDDELMGMHKSHLTITPIKETLRSRKSGEFFQFWFKTEANEAAVIEVRSDNSLINLFKGLFKLPELKIVTNGRVSRYGTLKNRHNYWKLSQFCLDL